MPLLLAWIPAIITWLFNAWRIFVAASFLFKIIKYIAGFVITYAVVKYTFGGFISNLVDWIYTSISYISPFINTLSVFIPENFETCIYIIVSNYVLSLVLSWKHRLAMALGAF
ncbi:hypothetical protein P3L44_10190 [Providencia sp. PROV175]|uniref:hypothetical protein n=1 Tax=Providencia TaxID=586 RepID=UPI00234A5E30|nr:hypothetical protein [Providencia sp. PROV175]WOB89083.1 hypothetical protein P3L44_10055 [Providencia sp. PROV175]WOB89107.1 hypothetical protein P3L44_10190 [Providencia sp. PROV175]